MFDREAIAPLAVGLIVAVMLHIATAAGVVVLREHDHSNTTDLTLESQPQPNLVAVSISVTEPRLVGEPAEITAAVKNTGQAPASGFELLCHIDDQVVGTMRINRSVAPGETIERRYTYTATTPGSKRVRVFADADDRVSETDETDNTQTQVFVWLTPPSASTDPATSGVPQVDLEVVDFNVPDPRIAGRTSVVLIDVANLRDPVATPTRVLIHVDGRPAGWAEIKHAMPSGAVIQATGFVRVDEPGKHIVTVTADAERRTPDIDRANNSMAKEYEWKPPIGQHEPSDTSVNWISYDDYQRLQARRSKVEQAAAQKQVDPAPAKEAPIDPTPPTIANPVNAKPTPAQVARLTEQASQQPQPTEVPSEKQPPLTPDAPVEPDVKPSTAKLLVDPTDAKAKPQQPVEATDDPTPKITQAPQLDTPTKVNEAEATQRGPMNKPSQIVETSADAPNPRQVTSVDGKPVAKAAPTQPGAEAREVAMITPPIDLPRVGDPLLPEPVDTPPRPTDRAVRKSPDVEPDENTTPDVKSSAQDGKAMREQQIASLPLEPRPTRTPGSPQKDDPAIDPDGRKTNAPDRPKVKDSETVDGDRKQDEDTPQRTPREPVKDQQKDDQPDPNRPQPNPLQPREQSPAAVAQVSRPTAAPRDTRESPPVTFIDHVVVKPGKVVAEQGIKINTAHARFSAVALRTSLPTNPDVKIIFDKSGKVIHASFVKSTGYANIDGPILASLYKWTAEGETLNRVPETLTLKVHLLLTDED